LHNAGFSEKELRLLEVLQELVAEGEREGFEIKAAIRLKCSPVTVRTRLSRMRAKYKDAKAFVTEYRSAQQKLYQKTAGKFHSL